ncbi:MAG: SIS domain-containing protein [Chloroflexi bacterium]|nr:SIS domain-containing protein [Chloroflexota bacterium]
MECALRAIDPSAVGRVVDALADTHAHGGNVFLCGNGGSASTASHMAADLAKGAPVGRVTGLRTVSLTDNVPIITAWGNDVDFSEVFAEQVRNLVRHRDALIAISASGNSPNILRAVEAAELQGAVTIGLCGFGGGRLAEMVDHAVIVTSDEYGPIEDVHLVLNHAIAESVRALRAVAPLVNHVGELR